MKRSNIITAGVMLVFIIAFGAASLIMPEKELLANENRPPSELPKLTWDELSEGSYAQKLGGCAADRFPYREDWIAAGARLRDGLFENVVNDVYIADDRLLAADTFPSGEPCMDAAKINAFAQGYDGAVYFTAVPTSAGVYGDILPSYMQSETEKQRIDRFSEELGDGIRKIDSCSILKMLSDNYIYYRSDTKWTSYGAYCVYRTVIQKLGFLPGPYDKYTVKHVNVDFKGDLYCRSQFMKSKPDILDVYEYSGGSEVLSCIGYDNGGKSFERSLYCTDMVDGDDKYRLYLGEKLPLVKITTSVNNEKKLLVVGDDYAACFIPFLTQHYSEIAFLSPECMQLRIEDYVDPDEYEQTLFLFGINSLDISDN